MIFVMRSLQKYISKKLIWENNYPTDMRTLSVEKHRNVNVILIGTLGDKERTEEQQKQLVQSKNMNFFFQSIWGKTEMNMSVIYNRL